MEQKIRKLMNGFASVWRSNIGISNPACRRHGISILLFNVSSLVLFLIRSLCTIEEIIPKIKHNNCFDYESNDKKFKK